MLELSACIIGRIRYGPQGRWDPGPAPGACRVQAHEGVVSITWNDKGASRSIVLSMEAFDDNLLAGSIMLDTSSVLCACGDVIPLEPTGARTAI